MVVLLCLVVLLVSSWLVWSWFARFCEGFSFLAGCVLLVVFVPGPRGVTKASWNVVVHLLFPTGLTGRVHRSDRRSHQSDWCGTDSRLLSFPLCLECLVELLVPRTSSTLVAMWS
jgi:hypothetical protein